MTRFSWKVLALLASIAGPAALAAQFSSDIPGVPRAAISVRGGHQNRTEWTFTGYRLSGDGSTAGDTLAAGLRLGLGQSYRVMGQFEIGYDFSLFDTFGSQTSIPSSAATGNKSSSTVYARGLTGYGVRVGAKYRPIVALDPDGNGYEVAFGGGVQPELKPLYGIEHQGDSTKQGGQFAGSDATLRNNVFTSNPFAKIAAATQLVAMASYRSRRITADAAIVDETSSKRDASTDPSPIAVFSGVSLRAGAAVRLTPSVAIGGTYWGLGAPPWRDDVQVSVPGKKDAQQFGFLLQFGSEREAGIDVMYTAPTGSYAESGRLYVRARSTR